VGAGDKQMALIKCEECQQTVSDKAESCPHCGAPQKTARQPPPLPQNSKQSRTNPLTALMVVGGGILAIWFISSKDSPSPKLPVISTSMMPGDESRMIDIVQRAHGAYSAAGSNELKAGSARPARAKELCALIKNTNVRDWIGVLSTLTTNNDGRGVIGVTLADDIEVKTWNNAVSDSIDQTLLDPDSSLYRAALELKKGTVVTFSGQFRQSAEDCLREASMTMAGSMTSPAFIFRFSSIKANSN
jgi:hypothetical protein